MPNCICKLCKLLGDVAGIAGRKVGRSREILELSFGCKV